ncbi:histidine phosphatase family protein [Companilactobacillus zhachilii]|uniref:histidine phosphatase family protein n=1 Tax=Companilactobacillus zhachilii TaxID=2304606 RepID=UPI0019212681|nr:histidine phosphatase family protein [Companilactobacillus zhachilii]MBL3530797.1 histidine phosphatase family protein [Companilactobacillus zhachilii]
MVELYIVRHGETDTNYTGKINGSATDLNLNETGKKQVKYLKEHLNIDDYDEVYASPLKRAQETADILNEGKHEIKTDSRLREINYGAWDGLLADDVQAKYPQCFDENNYLSANYSDFSEGAETYKSVLERLQSFIDDMSKKGDEKILVVCHGFVTRSFVQLVTEAPNIEDILEPINAGVTKIKISNSGRTYLGYYNRLENL